MRTHIKVVALLNILFGALGVLGGLALVVGGTLGSLFSGSFVGAVAGTAASLVGGLIISGIALVALVGGFGLLNGKSWARYVIIVVSVCRLFNFPWGTLIGVYSLWVLLNRETTQMFETTTTP